jgi:hypothetical protein
VEIPQREETMNTDFILYISMIAAFIIGFGFGRYERKDSYTKTYRLGYNNGVRVGHIQKAFGMDMPKAENNER